MRRCLGLTGSITLRLLRVACESAALFLRITILVLVSPMLSALGHLEDYESFMASD